MNLINEMVELVSAEVTAPGVDQRRGNWREDGGCCIGSRMAHALGVKSGKYLEGIDEWARRMGLTRAHVIVMLQDAGAGHDPIGPTQWPECPSRVWRNLARIESPPALTGRNLDATNLAGIRLSMIEMQGTSLKQTCLRGADLSSADLRDANLSGADLRNASLHCANLRGADLTGADLTGADLSKANVRGAKFDRARTAGANLNGTRLARRKPQPPAPWELIPHYGETEYGETEYGEKPYGETANGTNTQA